MKRNNTISTPLTNHPLGLNSNNFAQMNGDLATPIERGLGFIFTGMTSVAVALLVGLLVSNWITKAAQMAVDPLAGMPW